MFRPRSPTRLDGAAVNDKAGGMGQLRKKIALRRINGQGEGHGIKHPHPADGGGFAVNLFTHPDDVAQVGAGGQRTGEARISRPLKAIAYILSADRRAIGEAGGGPQMEGVGASIRRHFPAFRQIRFNRKLVIEAHQAAKDLMHEQSAGDITDEGRVEGGRVASAKGCN